MEVGVPGDYGRRITPGRSPALILRAVRRVVGRLPHLLPPDGQGVGNHVGNGPSGKALLIGHVGEILAEEGVGPHMIGSSSRENLGVPGPTQALVPLGAVRGNIKIVSLLPPLRI